MKPKPLPCPVCKRPMHPWQAQVGGAHYNCSLKQWNETAPDRSEAECA